MDFAWPAEQQLGQFELRCLCGLPANSPGQLVSWRPDLDRDPGPPVFVVARHGEHPSRRRAVRLGNDAGWAEYGSDVDIVAAVTPALHWERVGICWAGTPHPVVAYRPNRDGSWTPTGTLFVSSASSVRTETPRAS